MSGLTRPNLSRDVVVKYGGERKDEEVSLRCPAVPELLRVRELVNANVAAAVDAADRKKRGDKSATPQTDDGLLHAEVVKACLPDEYAEWELTEVFHLINQSGGHVSPLVVESFDLCGYAWYRTAVGLNDAVNTAKRKGAERRRPGIGGDPANP